MLDAVNAINIGLKNPTALNDIIDYYSYSINQDKDDMKYKINNQINYYIIERIPILLLIVSIICIILIFSCSYFELTPEYKLLLDKFCNLFICITSVIIGVYLVTMRFEYKNKMDYIKYSDINLYNIMKIKKLLINNNIL